MLLLRGGSKRLSGRKGPGLAASPPQSGGPRKKSGLFAEDAGVPDFIQLTDISEPAFLANLKTRHQQGEIYTYIGEVVVAVNPFRQLPIYGDDKIEEYRGREVGRRRGHGSPRFPSAPLDLRSTPTLRAAPRDVQPARPMSPPNTTLFLRFLPTLTDCHSHHSSHADLLHTPISTDV